MESSEACLPFRIIGGEIHEHADASHPLGLRACDERPCGCRAAEQREELASSQGLRPPLWARGANDHPPADGPCSRFAAGSAYHGGWYRILGRDLKFSSESRVQCRYFRIRACHSPTGFSPSSTRCAVWQFSIRARALRPVNVDALTHWHADHAILFYC